MAKGLLVRKLDGRLEVEAIEDYHDLIRFMANRGFAYTGLTDNSRCVREELWNQPQFEGLIGPMWGGEEHPLRYEDQAAYDIISS